MKILAVNASAREKGTTSRLAEAALRGAASAGAQTRMVMLSKLDIRFCANCLTCYQDFGARIGACSIDDDVTGVLEEMADADGVLFASPVHSGFVTGLMTTFLERAVWRLCRPSGEILGIAGAPEPRLTDKARACASIVSAGMTPAEMRRYCDMGTVWLRDMAPLLVNGEFVGDMYAAGEFPREIEREEASKKLLLRELTEAQLEEAYALGVRMAQAVRQGVKPYDAGAYVPPEA